MTERKVALVTGASRGFGRIIAETLAQRGYTVFAGMRDPANRNREARDRVAELAAAGLPIVALELDVADEAAADVAAAAAIERAGRIDVLVNNAGYSLAAIAECCTPGQVRQLFETLYFGAHRMCRAVLPQMRKQRTGLLVQISSFVSRLPTPNSAHYAAAKAALEALAEVYRYELAPFGVDSVIVQPGAYPTGIFESVHWGEDTARAAEYGPYAELPRKAIEGVLTMFKTVRQDPQQVGDAVAELAEMPFGKRPLRTLVGQDAQFVAPLNDATAELSRRMLAMFGFETRG